MRLAVYASESAPSWQVVEDRGVVSGGDGAPGGDARTIFPRVALLFLSRGPMPLESSWRQFFESAGKVTEGAPGCGRAHRSPCCPRCACYTLRLPHAHFTCFVTPGRAGRGACGTFGGEVSHAGVIGGVASEQWGRGAQGGRSRAGRPGTLWRGSSCFLRTCTRRPASAHPPAASLLTCSWRTLCRQPPLLHLRLRAPSQLVQFPCFPRKKQLQQVLQI